MALPPNGYDYRAELLSYTNKDRLGKAACQVPNDVARNEFTSSNNIPLPSLPQTQHEAPKPRLLTVDEALQYSPFSSIIPFSPEIIPAPNALNTSSASILDSSSIGNAARQQIARIDEELHRHKGNSALALKAFNELKPLLHKDDLTEYHIKDPGGTAKAGRNTGDGPTYDCKSAVIDAMSPFARMVYDATDIAYSLDSNNVPPPPPSNNSAAATSTKQSLKPPPKSKPPLVALPSKSSTPTLSLPTPVVQGERIIQNQGATSRNTDVSAVLRSPPLTPSKQQPMVLIKPLPNQVPRSEYKPIREDISRVKQSPHARKTYVSNQDQRAAADEASQKLRNVVSEIIEAEVSSEHSSLVRYVEGGQEALSDAGLSKLVPSLQKAVSFGRLHDIAVEDLIRIQILCESLILQSESADVVIRPDCSDVETSHWCNAVEEVTLALRSSRVVLCIMEACCEEKQLHSEELLQSIVRFIENITRSCIMPVLECRNDDTSSALFNAANEQKKYLSQLMQQVGKALSLIIALTAKLELPETVINSTEYLAFQLLFVENASSEKDSVLGTQKFESLRRIAMDVVGEIFSRYREQRTAILEEILTSLQKLPISRQHARQYRLNDGSSIQLVSALIMRLIQSAATPYNYGIKCAIHTAGRNLSSKKTKTSGHVSEATDGDLGSEEISEDNSEPDEDGPRKPRVRWFLRRLAKKAAPLCDEATTMTSQVVRFFVSRAMNASKSGDQPHRHLLDIFCEDLLLVVSHPEWPASELLLRLLLMQMVEIAEKPNYSAPAKAMALETLGQMGSAISDFVAHTRNLTRTAENTPKNMNGYLAPIFEDYLESNINPGDLYDKAGVYNMVLDYMQSGSQEDAQLKNACGYYLAFYAKAFATADLDDETVSVKYLGEIDEALSGAEWLVYNWGDALPVHRRLAYALTVLNMDFFRQFDRIMKLLLDSIISDQVTVRNKSLKSVTFMLEKEPSILDCAKNVKTLIIRCATDSSPQVRDSALMLIGKCVSLRPSLEQDFRNIVLKLSEDTSLSVRKRSIKLLKEMFSRTTSNNVRAAISECILRRTTDDEKSVSELARQSFEETWLSPFWSLSEMRNKDVSDKLAMIDQIEIMTQTIKRGENTTSILVSLLSEALSSRSKEHLANFKICKAFVALSLDIMLGAESAPHEIGQKDVLPLLTAFAQSDARLFSADQLQYLQPYVSNIASMDDLDIFRPAVIIFRIVLPTLPNVQNRLLGEVQSSLLQNVSKLPLAVLEEVAACLWTINATLQNIEKLIKLTASVIKNLQDFSKLDLTDPAHNAKVPYARKYIRLAGSFGQHCDFEDHKRAFTKAAPRWQGPTVAGLFVSSILPFTRDDYPLPLRAESYHGIGAICQRWPYQFNQADVSETFQAVLSSHEQVLQKVVLSGFRDFFLKQERQAEVKLEEQAAADKKQVNGKLGASMTASDSDEASALIAQRFLKDVTRICLTSNDNAALTATEVITSINRQGLVHPKESAPALVALETSTNPEIASIAYKAHLRLHQQHESMFEREYSRCLPEVFAYQKNITGDTLGYTTGPLTSKLHSLFEVINTSNGKYQQKFISMFCSRIDFDVSELDVSESIPSQLQFARFLIENLAFFDYVRVDELQHTVACMEKIVIRSGSSLSHTISVELGSFLESAVQGIATEQDQPNQLSISNGQPDALRLRQIATGATILACLWEARTHLRRLYGLNGTQRRGNKGKPSAKDLTAAPSKVSGISGEKLVTAIAEKINALASQETMLSQCKEFVELMSVDSEVKVAELGEDETGEVGTPSDDEGEPPAPASGGSRKLKRKGSESANGTPYKKRGRPALGARRKSGKRNEEDSDWE